MAATDLESLAPAPRAGDFDAYRRSAPYFAALLLFAIPAFWPSYLHPPKVEADWHVHAHGIALFLWGALLVAQPALVQARRLAWHRALGKASYVLAPWIVVSTVLLLRYRLSTDHSPPIVYFSWIILGLTTLFAVAYAGAIAFRRDSARHARFMACTALTMVDPIFARLLYNFLGVEPPLMQVATFALVDGILLLLWLRDLRHRNGIRVYPAMLAAFVAFEIPTFVLPASASWAAFLQAFGALPLP